MMIFDIVCSHNLHGTFAAAISAFKDSTQIIKISDYYIHPKHQVDPRKRNFGSHNLAILKLACRFSKNIQLFNQIILCSL